MKARARMFRRRGGVVSMACARPLCMLAAGVMIAAGSVTKVHAQSALGSSGALPVLLPIEEAGAFVSVHSLAVLAVLAGFVVAFAMAATALARERTKSHQNSRLLAREVGELRARHDRYATLIASEPQVIISWSSRDAEPVIEGDTGLILPGASARRVLAFGAWLVPSHAQALDNALNALKNGGERFRLGLRALDGRYFEADGRAISGQAVFRLRETTVDRQELARTRDALTGARGDLSALRTMLDAMPQPIWLRDHEGTLIWVNHAYAVAVGALDGAEVIARQIEILDAKSREDARLAIARSGVFSGRVKVDFAGARLSFEVVESPGGNGTAGMASDVSALETARDDLERLKDAHARTLDRLPTAIAIFDAEKRLVFYNAAYRKLWALDDTFLASNPGDSAVLDRLRSDRKLPEQADFRKWKSEIHSAYGASASQDHSWYLPDGRTLHVVITPNTQGNGAGGVTYVFDDVSERFRLESRYNALVRRQGETLDSLREGVAVFGSDGGLKLSNPAFSDLWQLDDDLIVNRPHVDVIANHCAALSTDATVWSEIRLAVAGLHDIRTRHTFRVVRLDGTTLDCSAAPLPDGSTLVTCTDITASVSIERALTERNEALEKASRIRDDFVHHVSYELRSPLTSAIGFAQLLAEETVGPLNDKQREYADHITRSSESLLALINDILDLATIDNGGMEMMMGDVDVAEAVASAIRGIEGRLAEKSLKLRVDVPVEIGTFHGDAKRVRQVLYNLLSNAVSSSYEGETLIVDARRDESEICIAVTDHGSGLMQEQKDRLLSRAKTTTNVGLSVDVGLSLASSFVELHGGRIEVIPAIPQGTRIVCAFPIQHISEGRRDRSGREFAA